MPPRVGVVGTNFGAAVHVPAFLSEGAEVVLCGRDHARLAAAAGRWDVADTTSSFDKLLADDRVSIVSIATPVPSHAPMALAALAAGKHVLVEKPFALDASEAREMRDAALSSGKVAMVAHEFRHASARRRVDELLAEGFIGSPRFALARLVSGPTSPSSELRPYREADDSARAGAGLLFRLGSHYVDCFRAWFGEVVAVSAHLRTVVPERDGGDESVAVDADDTYSFHLEFASGCFVEMFGTRHAPFGSEFGITIFGSEGVLETPQEGINPPARGELRGARLGEGGIATIPIPDRLEPIVDERDDRLAPFRLLVRDLFAAVEGGGQPSPSFEDGYRCQLVLDALRQSATSGERVEMVTTGASGQRASGG